MNNNFNTGPTTHLGGNDDESDSFYANNFDNVPLAIEQSPTRVSGSQFSTPQTSATKTTRDNEQLQNVIKMQRQQLKEKDEQLEKIKNGQIPQNLNKDDVKKAMQNIITMEVEQRTKAWISQQPKPASNSVPHS